MHIVFVSLGSTYIYHAIIDFWGVDLPLQIDAAQTHKIII